MSTMTGNLQRTMLLGAVGLLVLVGAGQTVRADVASDKPGAILIYPKIVVDTSGVLLGAPTDTEIQLTNTSNSVVGVNCFLIDMTSRCSNDPTRACTAAQHANANGATPPPPGACAPGASCVAPCTSRVAEVDFSLTLTKRQPISWKASQGLSGLPCGVPSQGPGCTGSNGGSSVPGTQTDPFIGEIKCVEVDPATGVPSAGLDPTNNNIGDLKGEATIVSYTGAVGPTGPVDARKYNAIGLQATGHFPAPIDGNGNSVLSVGGLTPQYNGCPKVVILDNMFDGAVLTTHAGASSGSVFSDLTVVPCSEDLGTQAPTSATLQFLIYNEFEQRFSTSTSLNCFRELQLSDIDTRPGNLLNNDLFSIFNVNVQGTASGQIRIRPVASATSDKRVLALTEEFWTGACPNGRCTTAANTVFVPGAGIGDTVVIPPGLVP